MSQVHYYDQLLQIIFTDVDGSSALCHLVYVLRIQFPTELFPERSATENCNEPIAEVGNDKNCNEPMCVCVWIMHVPFHRTTMSSPFTGPL